MENSPLGPDDVSSLYEGLRQALSPDINVQKAAESTLKCLEGRQGFCSCLAVRWILFLYVPLSLFAVPDKSNLR